MDKDDSINTQLADMTLSAASSLVSYAIGGPVGAVVGSIMTPSIKLAYDVIQSWNERRKARISRVVEEAFAESGKGDEEILQEMMANPEWADSLIAMIQQLIETDPELDRLFTEIMAMSIKTDDWGERNRLIVLNSSIKGLNHVQIQIIRCIYGEGGELSAANISDMVNVPEMELRNAVRDLELRGMIIDNGSEPTVWTLRELGQVIAKAINVLEV